MQLTIDHQSAADTSTDRKDRYRIHAATCPKAPFPIGDGTYIVEQYCWQPGKFCDRIAQRNMRPGTGQVWQEKGLTFFQIQHTGDADANAADLFFLHASPFDNLQEQSGHARHERVVSVTCQSRNTHLVNDGTIFHIHNCGAQVRTTKVTAYVFLHDRLLDKFTPSH